MSKIEIVDYRPEWPAEFEATAAEMRSALGSDAVRIDHIGSTSVPLLAAKDIIDIQISVSDISRNSSVHDSGVARQTAHGIGCQLRPCSQQ